MLAAAAAVVRFIDCSISESQTQKKKCVKKATREMNKKKKKKKRKTPTHATVVE